MTDVERLRWFVTVAEELHFGRAAATLGVSRIALSASITDLEAERETKLFVPGAQPTELTEAGESLLEEVRDLVRKTPPPTRETPAEPATLTIGFVPGVTTTKWERIWSERFRQVRLELVAVDERRQTRAISDGAVEMCFVRLPLTNDHLSAIRLYEEIAVVIVAKDHPASLFESVTLADLADEEILDHLDPADALDLVAGGAGVLIVPQSIARSHSRKDLVYLPVTDAPPTEIALAWAPEASTEWFEEFIGVVRGRSANSSRSPRGTDIPTKASKASGPKRTPPKTSPKPVAGRTRNAPRGGTSNSAAKKSGKRRGR